MDRNRLISEIRRLLSGIVPTASAILFGSYARGEENADSDVNLLILLDKDNMTLSEETSITDSIYDFEFKNGLIMSPIVMTKREWEQTKSRSSLYHQIRQQGILLQ